MKILLLFIVAPLALACSPSTGSGPAPAGGGTTSSPAQTSQAAANTTASAAQTTAASGGDAAAAYAKMSNKCKMGNKKEYLVVDPSACAQAKVGPCDLSKNMFCSYLQKPNAPNSFDTNKTPLQYDCKLLPCPCLSEIGASGDCAKGGGGGGGGGKIKVEESGGDGGRDGDGGRSNGGGNNGGNGNNGGKKKVEVQSEGRKHRKHHAHA